MKHTEEDAHAANRLFAAGLGLSIAAAAFCAYLASKFSDIYEQLGGDLPLITQVVASFPWVAWFFPFVVVMFASLSIDPYERGRRSLVIGLFGGIALCVTVVFALYLPISRMGAVVS